MSGEERFISYLQLHGIQPSVHQLELFRLYAQMLIKWNQKMNLTAISDEEGIYIKHFYDSLIPSFDIDFQGKVCDVGSGAGFPSIPLKIMNPDLEVTIIEPLGKRVMFLNELAQRLGLDITILNKRAEDCSELRESFDIVTARAVANMALLCELCIPLVKVHGRFVVMKGSGGREELHESGRALRILGCNAAKIYENDEEDAVRINIECVKIKATPKGYPRAFAKMKKNPLRGE